MYRLSVTALFLSTKVTNNLNANLYKLYNLNMQATLLRCKREWRSSVFIWKVLQNVLLHEDKILNRGVEHATAGVKGRRKNLLFLTMQKEQTIVNWLALPASVCSTEGSVSHARLEKEHKASIVKNSSVLNRVHLCGCHKMEGLLQQEPVNSTCFPHFQWGLKLFPVSSGFAS